MGEASTAGRGVVSRVFVDVDTQRDFMEADGALPVPGAEGIVGTLGRLTARARERGIPILATACAHRLDEADPEPFPPHCLEGTAGQCRIEATAWRGPAGSGVVLDADGGGDLPSDSEGVPAHLTLEKRRYDVFSNPRAEEAVALYRRGGADPVFTVYGVATDYCVRAAALGLLARGCRVEVVVDAIRAVDPGAEAGTLAELTAAGAVLTHSERVLAETEGGD